MRILSQTYHETNADSLANFEILGAVGLGTAVDELCAVLDELLLGVEEICYLVGHFLYVGVV